MTPAQIDDDGPKKAGPKARKKPIKERERASVRHGLRPVRIDLRHQSIGQRHVVERLGLGIAIGVDPLEELLGVLGASGVLRPPSSTA